MYCQQQPRPQQLHQTIKHAMGAEALGLPVAGAPTIQAKLVHNQNQTAAVKINCKVHNGFTPSSASYQIRLAACCRPM
jgi:hypothetical protein